MCRTGITWFNNALRMKPFSRKFVKVSFANCSILNLLLVRAIVLLLVTAILLFSLIMLLEKHTCKPLAIENGPLTTFNCSQMWCWAYSASTATILCRSVRTPQQHSLSLGWVVFDNRTLDFADEIVHIVYWLISKSEMYIEYKQNVLVIAANY